MANVLIFSLQGNIQRRYLTSLAIPFSRFNYNFTIFYFTFCICTSFLWNQPKLSFFPQQWHDQISHKNRTSLQNNTNYFNTIHTVSSTGFWDKFIFSIRQSSMPTSRTSMGSCIWRWTLLSFWSSLQCIVSLLRTRGNMMNARSTSKHFEEAQIWKPWEGEIPHEKNSWMLKFSLTCRLTCRIIYTQIL